MNFCNYEVVYMMPRVGPAHLIRYIGHDVRNYGCEWRHLQSRRESLMIGLATNPPEGAG